MKISVIGGGSWGIALANTLAFNEHDILVFDVEQEVIDGINNKNIATKLENKTISKRIKASSSLEEVVNYSDILLVAVPTKVMRNVLGSIYDITTEPKHFLNVSKGIEPDTNKRMSEVYSDVLKEKLSSFSVLTGPSHAEEVIEEMLTTVSIASTNLEQAKSIQKLFNNTKFFRAYVNEDLVGCELGGSLKNVIAIAGGYIQGVGLGDNAKAALLTRSMVEIIRLADVMGGKHDTLFGLSGLGDLIVTATSVHSRNFNAGLNIAKGQKIDQVSMTVEGVRTAKAVYEVIKKNNIYAPIFTAVYKVLYEDAVAKDIIPTLLASEGKTE